MISDELYRGKLMKVTILTLLIIFLSSAVFGQNSNKPETGTDTYNTYLDQHKPFTRLSTTFNGSQVVLNFSRSNWYNKKSEYDSIYKKFRIYRKAVNFVFDRDHREFFDGLECSEKDLIYSGPSKTKSKNNFVYEDNNVVSGQTYAYWVAADAGRLTGPVPVKVRDPNIWWSQNKITEKLKSLGKTYPELVNIEIIGKSVEGRDIYAIKVGKAKKKLALIGAIHASESGPELIIYAIEDLLQNHKSIFDKVTIVAVPCMNVDEREKAVMGIPWYLRRNTASVDMNRNFPGDWEEISYKYGTSTAELGSGTYRGASPASEPETKAVVSFIQKNKPDVVLSYHHLASITGRCLWAASAASKDEVYKQKCKKIYDAYTEGYCKGYADENPQENYLKYATTPGSIPVWCYKNLGIPGFDVERHTGIEKSLSDETDVSLLSRNQKQHASALLSLMDSMK